MYDFILEDWSSENSLVRSLFFPFVVAVVGAYFGARFGAMSAQRRDRKREALVNFNLAHRSSIDAAILLKASLEMKKQQIAEMVNNYLISREIFLNDIKINKSVNTVFDLRKLDIVRYNRVHIEEAVPKIAGGEAKDVLHLSAAIQSLDTLNVLVEERNMWIDKHQGRELSDIEVAGKYYGIPCGGGTIDTQYKSYMEGLLDSNDDLIFHCYRLYESLAKKSLEKKRFVKKKFRVKLKCFLPEFQTSAEWFPDFDDYRDWLKAPIEEKKRPYDSDEESDLRFLQKVLL